jgi:quercetin dioxygenase-like cupin family protein
MEVFDMNKMGALGYEQKTSKVFFERDSFKTRIIELKKGQIIPECKMDSYVIFYVIDGEVLIKKNGEKATIVKNNLMITEPAIVSMESEKGARLFGIQIK